MLGDQCHPEEPEATRDLVCGARSRPTSDASKILVAVAPGMTRAEDRLGVSPPWAAEARPHDVVGQRRQTEQERHGAWPAGLPLLSANLRNVRCANGNAALPLGLRYEAPPTRPGSPVFLAHDADQAVAVTRAHEST